MGDKWNKSQLFAPGEQCQFGVAIHLDWLISLLSKHLCVSGLAFVIIPGDKEGAWGGEFGVLLPGKRNKGEAGENG